MRRLDYKCALLWFALANLAYAQDPLDLQISKDIPTVIPDGYFSVSDTVVGSVTGGKVIGACEGSVRQSAEHWMSGLQSVLIWAGEDAPMFRLSGVFYHLQDFTISQAPIGIEVRKRNGLGSGKHTISNIFFNSCGTAVKIGHSKNEKGCDSMRCNNLFAHNCGTVYQVNNSQGMEHDIQNVKVTGVCDTVIDIKHGGIVRAKGIDVRYAGLVLKLHSSRKWELNSNSFEVDGVKVDAQAAGRFRLFEADDVRAIVRFACVEIAKPVSNALEGTGDLCRVTGPTKVIIERSSGMPSGCIESGPVTFQGQLLYPHFIFRDCTVSDAKLLFTPGSKARLTSVGCGGWNEEPSPAYNAELIEIPPAEVTE